MLHALQQGPGGQMDIVCCDLGKPHGMLSIVGLADDVIEGICAKALRQAPAGSICQIANFLFPQVPFL